MGDALGTKSVHIGDSHQHLDPAIGQPLSHLDLVEVA